MMKPDHRFNGSAADFIIRHFDQAPCEGDAEDWGPVSDGSRPHGTIPVQLHYRGRGKPSPVEEDDPPTDLSWLIVFAAFAIPCVLVVLAAFSSEGPK